MKNEDRPSLFNKSFQLEWSEKYKYKHIHTGEHCTFEAYIAEYIVLRRAEKLNLGKPGYKFWTKGDPNHWIWTKQLMAARSLKKKYSEEAIIKAIMSKDFDKLLVLGIQNGRGYKINPLAEKIIAKYHTELQKQNKIETPNINVPDKTNIRNKQFVNKDKTSINKLRNL
jgi:hypothetical protein